jgi:signal transduction histidine kinase
MARGHAFRDHALMRGSSLANRLFLSATAWLVVILAVTGIVLSSVYRNATERAFDRRLNLYLRTLIAEVATPDEPPDHQFQSLGEPLFELPLSGWYWQISRTDSEKPELRASRSLWDKKLPKLEERGADLSTAGIRLGYVDGPEGQNLRMVERPVDLGADGKFLVSVAGDATEIFDETRAFDYYLGGTFTALGIVLLLTTIFQVRFGLAPLKRISESIADIRSGRAERLEGEFPVEIAPLARETNALIDANREIVERSRTHVGNLAHAIKTPLSVIVNEASAHVNPFATKVLEQADVMRDQVAHHLERARIAARPTIIGTVTEVAPAIEALRRTMEKIHRDRGITIGIEANPRAKFRGERQDLDEMAGNLVDNACKWAASHVFIEVLVEPPHEPGGNPMLRIIVDDDGRGLSAAERAQVSRRGQRLDESKPGSGLGLSIVVDLAALYGGSLSLGSAPIGGLRAELVLPGV